MQLLEKNEVMNFAYKWINMESIMLSEIVRETDIERLHSSVEYKITE